MASETLMTDDVIYRLDKQLAERLTEEELKICAYGFELGRVAELQTVGNESPEVKERLENIREMLAEVEARVKHIRKRKKQRVA